MITSIDNGDYVTIPGLPIARIVYPVLTNSFAVKVRCNGPTTLRGTVSVRVGGPNGIEVASCNIYGTMGKWTRQAGTVNSNFNCSVLGPCDADGQATPTLCFVFSGSSNICNIRNFYFGQVNQQTARQLANHWRTSFQGIHAILGSETTTSPLQMNYGTEMPFLDKWIKQGQPLDWAYFDSQPFVPNDNGNASEQAMATAYDDVNATTYLYDFWANATDNLAPANGHCIIWWENNDGGSLYSEIGNGN
jgi:hypothetical protein